MNRSSIIKLLVVFIIAAVLTIAICIFLLNFMGVLGPQHDPEYGDMNYYTTENNTESALPVSEDSSAEDSLPDDSQITEQVSRKETITSHIGKERSGLDILIPQKTSKNSYSTNLSYFCGLNEEIDSFTFIIHSEDDETYIENLQCALAYSMTPGWSDDAGGNQNWYQCPDTFLDIYDSYAEVTINTTDETRNFINKQGQVMFGHWFSQVENIRLTDIICNKTYTAELDVAGTNSSSDVHQLNYNEEKEFSFPASELISDRDMINSINYHISAEGEIGKLSFELSLRDKNGNESVVSNAVQLVYSDSTDVTWILPDNIARKADDHSIITFRYLGSNYEKVEINNISVTYTNN